MIVAPMVVVRMGKRPRPLKGSYSVSNLDISSEVKPWVTSVCVFEAVPLAERSGFAFWCCRLYKNTKTYHPNFASLLI